MINSDRLLILLVRGLRSMALSGMSICPIHPQSVVRATSNEVKTASRGRAERKEDVAADTGKSPAQKT